MEDRTPYDMSATTGSRRNDARARLKLPARLVLLYGSCSCTVADISRKGACVITDYSLKVGDHGVLQRHGLDHFFSVQWVRDDRIGLNFDEVVPKDTILRLRQLAENFERDQKEQLREFGREWVAGSAGHARDR
jgi:hypothetical protein